MKTENRELDEINTHTRKKTDISDHLPAIYLEAVAVEPRLIVELGVRSGESTFALERAARVCGAHLLSLDISDCSAVSSYERWTFLRKDDIGFAPEFAPWAVSLGLAPAIDVLFIDTSHLYEHTVLEIGLYFPLLSAKAKVIFHDTNLKLFGRRKDGSLLFGYWNNRRGVIRAIEEHFGTSYDEKKDFVDVRDGWRIRHYSYCNGLTVLDKNIG